MGRFYNFNSFYKTTTIYSSFINKKARRVVSRMKENQLHDFVDKIITISHKHKVAFVSKLLYSFSTFEKLILVTIDLAWKMDIGLLGLESTLFLNRFQQRERMTFFSWGSVADVSLYYLRLWESAYLGLLFLQDVIWWC